MPDTPQQHAEAIKAAAQAYYDAVSAAEEDGLSVSTDVHTRQFIGRSAPSYQPTVTVSATHQQDWKA